MRRTLGYVPLNATELRCVVCGAHVHRSAHAQDDHERSDRHRNWLASTRPPDARPVGALLAGLIPPAPRGRGPLTFPPWRRE